jgi:hypothetical protein
VPSHQKPEATAVLVLLLLKHRFLPRSLQPEATNEFGVKAVTRVGPQREEDRRPWRALDLQARQDLLDLQVWKLIIIVEALNGFTTGF